MAVIQAMTLATGALVAWMSSNLLRLNPSKTQYIWLGTRQQLGKLDLATMAVSFPDIAFSLTVRDLGLRLDQQLTFAPHINRLCRDCYYQLRQLRVISRSLTSTATATLVHAFVTSRLDYCSTLYVGLPAVRLGCLERVIRTAARIIGGIPRTGHVSAYMLDVLHWLPLRQLIIFRIGAMVWRCILGLAPAYLRDLCHPTHGTRGRSSLRSSEQGLLLFLLLVPPQPRPVHSRWLAPLCGMGFLCRNDCSPGFFLTHSTLASKLLFLAVQGSGALLSSNLEGALYKSP